ncbi:MAG TPA: prepilin-type N-terminal cleavage/methylation domain-containing protein [Jatrophihabitans sp.]|nr:prepilin-type N-terminal cleavage/methylation domain-containing protein [Jatrophihabitans sp.]
MLERIREARRNESGFTLIELLIVIVILGVLAGIVVFAVSNFNDDGKAAACKSDVKNVEIAQEAYYAKAPSGTHVYAASVDALVTAKYLKEAPAASEGITTDATGAVSHTCSIT